MPSKSTQETTDFNAGYLAALKDNEPTTPPAWLAIVIIGVVILLVSCGIFLESILAAGALP